MEPVAQQKHTAAEITQFLREYQRRSKKLVIVSHYNPDADAFGSSCGLSLALQNVGFSVRCVNESGISDRYAFIPGVKEVVSDFAISDFGSDRPEVVIVCDCGDRARVGDKLKAEISRFPIVINIDHHISNDFFGHYNYVVASASSTAELVYDVLAGWPETMSTDVARCLYAGIVADTGSFRYAATTAKTFSVASMLVAAGAQPAVTAQAMFGQERLASIRLYSEGIRSLELLAGGQIAIMMVSQKMLDTAQADLEDTESFVERIRDISGVRIAAIVKEDLSGPEPLWRVSLRSREAQWDVAAVADAFGGGGHKMAAAFRWRRSAEELRKELDSRLLALVSSGR